MKKLSIVLLFSILTLTTVYAQETVVIQRPGIFTDIASATGMILSLPFSIAEGVVVGAVEATGSLIHGSTEIIVVPPAKPVPGTTVPVVAVPVHQASVVVPRAPAVIPTTTIVTTNGDGTVTTVTRSASAYELGSVIMTPISPSHRVGTSPHVNPYVYRPR